MRAMARDRDTFAEALVQDLDDEQRHRLRTALDAIADRMDHLTRPMRESKEAT